MESVTDQSPLAIHNNQRKIMHDKKSVTDQSPLAIHNEATFNLPLSAKCNWSESVGNPQRWNVHIRLSDECNWSESVGNPQLQFFYRDRCC